MQSSLTLEPLLAGRYAHVRELGRGASGRVLLCADRVAGGTRAVKIVSADDAERLRWELTLLSSIAHPGLARVYELVTIREPLGPPFRLEPGAAALVEEHVDGASAAEVVASLGTDEERVRFAVTVGIAVARALGAIHAAGLIHGDVKPANVVVPEDPSLAKLVDLGLARAPGLSATLSGTPGYLAPEAWLGERSVATDLYALGASLHALCAGRSAFDTEGSTQSLARALASRPTAAELPTAAPIALRRLVGDLLADAPSERPASAREVALRLSALASEVGALVPDADAVAEAPSPAERAARAHVRPLVGRHAELPALVAALRSPGVHVISGPPGAGRSRLVREAVRALQAEAARAGGRVPTYVAASDARVPRLAHDAIVHLEGCRLERAAWEAAVEAAAAGGVALSIVAEPGEDVPDAAAHLGPLDDPSLRRLLAELLELDPAPPLLAAARAASGGLAGRLCRLVAEGFEAGLDPSRPATLEELGRRSATRAWIPHRARPLAELLAAAGGALDAEAAAALLDDAAEQAVALRSAGVAHEARGKIALRADLCAVLARGFDSEARRALADRLAAVSLDAHAAAHVHAARGDLDGARESFLEAMRQARRAGDPERAAAIGAEGLAACAGDVSVALAGADALRACAREAEALAILEERSDPDAVALRAELARLLGDHARAREDAERASAESALAKATLARLSLADADPERALALADAAAEGAAAARLAEVRAFAQLALGRVEDARAEAARGLAGARRSGSLAEEARAIGTEGVVLASVGRLDEAAQRYERAFELADRAGERHAAASFLVNVGLGRLERGEIGPAIDALREGARRLAELERRGDATRALYNLGNGAALAGDDDVARDAIRRAARWARELGDASASALSSIVEAELALRAGKIDAARRGLDEAFADERTPPAVRATVGARLAIVRAVSGDVASASALLEQLDPSGAEAEHAIARARVRLAAGADAADDAERALAAAAHGGWETRLRAELVASEALERAGRGADAAACLARARVLIDRAASSLPVRARALLRAVPAYQRALASAPGAPREPGGDRWRALAAHAKRLAREPRVARLREAIVDAAIELADAERGFLVARAADGGLRVLAARAFGAELTGERPSESVAARVLDGGRPLVTVDAQGDERLGRAASVHAMALRSVLAVPIPVRGGRALALVLDDRVRPGAFDEETVALARDLADLAASALEGAEALRRERRERRRLARSEERLFARIESQERELSELRRRGDEAAFSEIVATSAPMRRALELARRVALSDAPVLLRGESGTGKELVARAIHEGSPRKGAAYVSENVSAIPETLLESALFGHVRGAFTGAERARRGLFEIADGGTLFLDEIGEMSEPLQAKLLRVLQDGELRPIGGEEGRRVDVRVVTATHRDLEAMVASGRFREDLFYRIAVVQVELPPLRQRPEDVAPLVAELLERHAPGRRVRVDRAAMSALRAYAWPGNVRQLENELRRALVLCDDVIEPGHLSPVVRGEDGQEQVDELDLKGQIDSLERRLIRAALERTSGNQTRAAELLGLSRYGLAKMMKRLALDLPS